MKSTAKDREFAKRFACSVSTLQRWRRQGAPLGDSKAMPDWLASRRTLPSGTLGKLARSPRRRPATPKSESPTEDAEAADEGAPHTLRRLEVGERLAHQSMLGAVLDGDPIKIKAARAHWIAIAGELRRFDSSVDRERRESDSIARGEAESVLKSIMRTVRISLREAVLFAALQRLPADQQTSVAQVLGATIDSWLVTACDCLSGAGLLDGSPLPGWAKSALTAQLSNQFPGVDLATNSEAVRVFVREFTAKQTEAMIDRR